MHTYSPRTFSLPELSGLSEKQIRAHLGLYEGYVKHTNILREQIKELTTLDQEKYAYAIAETRRRLGFEFNGMRMHEYYFEQLEGSPTPHDESSALTEALIKKYGSFESCIAHVTQVGMSRGIGWTVLTHDTIAHTIHTSWVSDHEIGQLTGLPVILAMDMWEHAYMVDYLPAEKKNYIEAFLKNVNWGVVEKRYSA
jgi:superoxide dismutase, Fe-Mn family